jgi:hypothetical protein
VAPVRTAAERFLDHPDALDITLRPSDGRAGSSEELITVVEALPAQSSWAPGEAATRTLG